jgi:hypothetical protein
MNMNDGPSLLRNDLNSANHWLKLALRGTKSNRAAIGATVILYTAAGVQADAVLSQSSFLSANDPRLHFGLGSLDKADKITVRWPSGAEETFPGVAADSLYELVEGSGKAERIEMKR